MPRGPSGPGEVDGVRGALRTPPEIKPRGEGRALWPKGPAAQKPQVGASLGGSGGGGRGCRGSGSRQSGGQASGVRWQILEHESGGGASSHCPHAWTPRHSASGRRHPLPPRRGTPLVLHRETFASACGRWPCAPPPAGNQSSASGLDAVPAPPEASACSSGWGGGYVGPPVAGAGWDSDPQATTPCLLAQGQEGPRESAGI